MSMLTEEKTFLKQDFTQQSLPKGEYEYCNFQQCNFSQTDLSGIRFLECTFTGCNLSLAKLLHTAMRDLTFKDCKMLGLRFDECDAFGFSVSFNSCQLNHSSFYERKLKKMVFKECQLMEVDFTGSDLSAAIFSQCNLNRAVFSNTILEKADLRTALHYSIDPENNRIKKAKFSLHGVAGLLDKYDIEIEPL